MPVGQNRQDRFARKLCGKTQPEKVKRDEKQVEKAKRLRNMEVEWVMFPAGLFRTFFSMSCRPQRFSHVTLIDFSQLHNYLGSLQFG